MPEAERHAWQTLHPAYDQSAIHSGAHGNVQHD